MICGAIGIMAAAAVLMGEQQRDTQPPIPTIDWDAYLPGSIQHVSAKADCEGCGAPLKAYIHHCEYCRRAN